MYTIGRLARRAKVKVDTIRFYERQGLLASSNKTDSGYRLYTDEALRRIIFIKHAQRCGFSLAEAGELLQMHNGDASARAEGYRLAAQKQSEIGKTIDMLHAMSDVLAGLLASRVEPAQGTAMQLTDDTMFAALESGMSRQAMGAESTSQKGASGERHRVAA